MKDWHKALLAVLAAAIAAWKLREHKEELKDLHDELIKTKDESADLAATVSLNDKLGQPASVRRRTVLIKAGAVAEGIAKRADERRAGK